MVRKLYNCVQKQIEVTNTLAAVDLRKKQKKISSCHHQLKTRDSNKQHISHVDKHIQYSNKTCHCF